jgi:16S rRNA (guanine527-N7)-methyltransferase
MNLGPPYEAPRGALFFLQALTTSNKTTNLISFSSDDELIKLHLLDSLMALLACTSHSPLGTSSLRAIDVGTGGGFPGVPLALAQPSWSVTLLDSVRKKQLFLERIVSGLHLSGPALWGRAEDFAHDPAHRETYDLAFCRAVGRFSTALELTLPFLKIGGAFLAHRGEDGPEEAQTASFALKELGGTLSTSYAYQLPGLSKKRHIVRIEKTKPSPREYPRRVGLPTKKPL